MRSIPEKEKGRYVDKLDAEFNFGRQALDLRAYRQQLLSGNIANANTPNYKARDIDFAKTLQGALGTDAAGKSGPVWNSGSAATTGYLAMARPEGNGGMGGAAGNGGLRMDATHPGHLAGVAGAAAAASVKYGTPAYRTPYQSAMDGNTVELDSERVNFADNALHYETGLTVINQQLKTMLTAVSGGNGG